MSRRLALTILCMILLFLSFFLLIQDASPPVFSMDIFNYSIVNFVKSVEFSKAPSSSTLIHFHGCCSFFSVVRMKHIMRTGSILDSVGDTHRILFFAQMAVSMEVNPRMEVTL